MSLDLNDVGTLVGVIAGTVGVVFGLLNYFRDSSKIVVDLQWDMTAMNLPDYDPNVPWGVVRITNAGRRPSYVSHVAIKLPDGYDDSHLVLFETVAGQKLDEADPPLTYPVPQDGLNEYSKDWKKLRAQVQDSTGKIWVSKKDWFGKKPSWAE